MMKPERQQFVHTMVDALDAAEPAFDRAAGLERLLAAQRARAPESGRYPRRALGALVVAASLAAAVAFVVRSRPQALTFSTGTRSGEVGEWVATDGEKDLPLTFSEGTEVLAMPNSRLRVADVDAHGSRVVLERGEARAKVVHRADTHWRFDAGPFDVQVTGTELRVEWDPSREHFSTTVVSGSVIVHGPFVADGHRVTGGERCDIDLREQRFHCGPAATARLDQPAREEEVAPAAQTSSPEPEAETAATTPGHAGRQPSWLELEERGKHAQAIALAESAGLGRLYASASTRELMRLARAARLTGRSEIERSALGACRSRFPGSEDAGTAAYLLGAGSRGAEAARWFEIYLAEQPSGVLSREAAGRLVESYRDSGNSTAARLAAKRYLDRYPGGPHAAFARRTLSAGSMNHVE